MRGEPSNRAIHAFSGQIAAGVIVLATALMAWDHLWGNEGGPQDSFPVDPGTFLLTLGLILVTAVVVFGITVRRSARRPQSAHWAALAHSGLALVAAVPAAWLGFPAIVAGGGIALGVSTFKGPHRGLGITAVALGALVLAFSVVVTAFPTTDSD